jgi:hypothetical protein
VVADRPANPTRLRRATAWRAVLLGRAVGLALGLAATLALAGCGGSPPRPAGPVLVLDVKLGQPYEQRAILGATLLLDGEEVARFRQPRPESTVVFSRRLDAVAPGDHEVAVRLDAQVESAEPTVYSAVGLATFAGQQQPLDETGGPLADGESFRWRLKL